MAELQSRRNAQFLVDHVVLPPKLPQHAPSSAATEEDCLVELLANEASMYASKCEGPARKAWKQITDMLSTSLKIHNGGKFSQEVLERSMNGLTDNSFLALHLEAQNAGLIIHKVSTERSQFHAWEVAPTNAQSFKSSGRLIRTFPSRTMSVPNEVTSDRHFIDQVSGFLRQAHSEYTEHVAPKTKKAKDTIAEERDTMSPELITSTFMNILAAWGTAETPKTFLKHTREEVLYGNGKLPWRRSPHWLWLKVTIQLCLLHAFSGRYHESSHQYKSFMLFFMCRIPEIAKEADLPWHVLHVVNTKIARRLQKIGHHAMSFVTEAAQKSVSNTRAHLEQVWVTIHQTDIKPMEAIIVRGTHKDMALALLRSRSFLNSVLSRESPAVAPLDFQPPRIRRIVWHSHMLPHLEERHDDHERVLSLADFETWVEMHLDDWALASERSEKDCSQVAVIMMEYHDMAFKTYDKNPLEISKSILVIMCLWMALDKMCTRMQPLLTDYDPEVPIGFLEPLLLPSKSQMVQAKQIEEHMVRRQCTAELGTIFADTAPQSFAVRYYDQSAHLQGLRSNIESDAAFEREDKRQEWIAKSNQFRTLTTQASAKNYQYYWLDDRDISIHQDDCEKCSLERQAGELEIDRHEWPLPEDVTARKTVVFELQPPAGFVAWRDATWHIVQRIGWKRRNLGEDVEQNLSSYRPLNKHARIQPGSLSLASATKSFLRSHYRSLRFPTSYQAICVNLGLQFRLIDESGGRPTWICDQSGIPSVTNHCSLQLPDGPYKSMQWTVSM